MSRCPTCGRFPIDIEQRAKEWADDLNENKSLVKENAALRVDLAAALAQLAEKDAEAKRLREAVAAGTLQLVAPKSGFGTTVVKAGLLALLGLGIRKAITR